MCPSPANPCTSPRWHHGKCQQHLGMSLLLPRRLGSLALLNGCSVLLATHIKPATEPRSFSFNFLHPVPSLCNAFLPSILL